MQSWPLIRPVWAVTSSASSGSNYLRGGRSARTAVSGFAAVLAAVVALVSGPLLRRSASAAHPG